MCSARSPSEPSVNSSQCWEFLPNPKESNSKLGAHPRTENWNEVSALELPSSRPTLLLVEASGLQGARRCPLGRADAQRTSACSQAQRVHSPPCTGLPTPHRGSPAQHRDTLQPNPSLSHHSISGLPATAATSPNALLHPPFLWGSISPVHEPRSSEDGTGSLCGHLAISPFDL